MEQSTNPAETQAETGLKTKNPQFNKCPLEADIPETTYTPIQKR